MHVLVTGAAGYLGSILVPFLLKKGHKVTAIDSFIYKQTSLLDCCFDKNLTLVRGDVRDEDLVSRFIKKADVIIPLACLTGAPLCQNFPLEARSVNLEAIKLLVKYRSQSQQVIFPTTNSGYGIGEEGKFCDEQSPLRPLSLYGQLKVEAEEVILSAGNSITLRLATVFGVSPRMRLDLLVNDFVYRAVHDRFIVLFQAHFKRNYIHIRDVVRVFEHCINNFDLMKNEPYNVGLSSANFSKKELCEEIKKQIPDFYFTQAEVGEDPDKRDYIVSNAKIEKTGFKPQFSLQDGIIELKKAYTVLKRDQYANF